jgi:hypothetical protein
MDGRSSGTSGASLPRTHSVCKRLVNRIPIGFDLWYRRNNLGLGWGGRGLPVVGKQFAQASNGVRGDTSRSQANGSTLQHLKDAMKLRNTAAVLPPVSLSSSAASAVRSCRRALLSTKANRTALSPGAFSAKSKRSTRSVVVPYRTVSPTFRSALVIRSAHSSAFGLADLSWTAVSLMTPQCSAGRYIRKSGSRDAYCF